MSNNNKKKRSIKEIRTMKMKELQQQISANKIKLVDHPGKKNLRSFVWDVFQLPQGVNNDGNEEIIPGWSVCKLCKGIDAIEAYDGSSYVRILSFHFHALTLNCFTHAQKSHRHN